jgi:HAD superfamily hydrolase (TIGR01509 family)
MTRDSSPPARRIRAVVFDLDGLMFNTEDVFHLAGSELLRRRNLEMTREVMNAMLGRRPHEGFMILKQMVALQETVEELLDESRGIFFGLLEQHLAPMPGLFELLDFIELRGLPKGVATSSPRFYLEDMLSRFELLDRFPLRLTAEDVSHGKPHPEIYLKAADALEVDPSEMLVFEDSEAGTKSGVSAGAVVVSVPHGHTAHHDFAGAAFIADSLKDPRILSLLGS